MLWFVGLELEADGKKADPCKAYTAFIQLLLKKKLSAWPPRRLRSTSLAPAPPSPPASPLRPPAPPGASPGRLALCGA